MIFFFLVLFSDVFKCYYFEFLTFQDVYSLFGNMIPFLMDNAHRQKLSVSGIVDVLERSMLTEFSACFDAGIILLIYVCCFSVLCIFPAKYLEYSILMCANLYLLRN